MTEPDVALTDYVLTAESAVFAYLLSRQPSTSRGLRRPFIVLFAASGASSLLGGSVHGFFLSGGSAIGDELWRGALLALGIVSLCGWTIGARILFSARTALAVQIMATTEFVVYALVIVSVSDSFWVAVANYLPVTLFLMGSFITLYRATPERALIVGVAGLAATIVAAVVSTSTCPCILVTSTTTPSITPSRPPRF
jgi:hypothetical protein